MAEMAIAPVLAMLLMLQLVSTAQACTSSDTLSSLATNCQINYRQSCRVTCPMKGCGLCHAANTSSNNPSICEWCDAGYKLAVDKTSCQPCGFGYYKAAGCADTCTACAPNVTTTSATSAACDVCAAGYGATFCTKILGLTRCSTEPVGSAKTGMTLKCIACESGSYNLGGNTTACQKCACSQPPVCRVNNSCVATSGACVWGLALKGTPCPVSPGVNGTCGGAGVCQTTGLNINVDQVAIGSNERLIFAAKFASDTTGKTVQLFQSGTPGALTTFIFPLVDDGSYSTRDAVAGDGIFSNTKSGADCTREGDIYFTAVIAGQAAPAEVLTAKVHCFTPPTPAQVNISITQASTINTQLQQRIAQGNTVAQALSAIASTLRTTPGVNSTTVKITGAAVRWRSSQGLRFRAYVPLPGQRSGPLPEKDYVHGPAYEPPGWVTSVMTGGTRGQDHLPRPLAMASVMNTTAASCSPKGQAIVLAPYLMEFKSNGNDESDSIAAILASAGYTVTFKCDSSTACTAGRPQLADYKNWGQSAAVVLVSHGDSDDDGGNSVVFSGVKYSSVPAGSVQDDWNAGRIEMLADGTIGLTPEWFNIYANQLPGSIIYFSTCRSARRPDFANIFLAQGAGSFVGYTDYVAGAFAEPRGISTFTHLAEGKTVGTYPANGNVESDSNPAKFQAFNADPSRTLPVLCNYLASNDLFIEYTWPRNMFDLDTGTMFNGQQVGFFCHYTGAYMVWSGDDTSAGGRETVTVLLSAARQDHIFYYEGVLALRAAWFASGSSGPATVTVSLRNKATGNRFGSQQSTILPEAWSACDTTTRVGYVQFEVQGAPGSETISFTLTDTEPAQYGECRKVIKPSGVGMYPGPCATGTPLTLLPNGTTFQYIIRDGHRKSSCQPDDQQCWIHAHTKDGWTGWVPTGLPDQPQLLPCGAANGVAYVTCCKGYYGCTRPKEAAQNNATMFCSSNNTLWRLEGGTRRLYPSLDVALAWRIYDQAVMQLTCSDLYSLPQGLVMDWPPGYGNTAVDQCATVPVGYTLASGRTYEGFNLITLTGRTIPQLAAECNARTACTSFSSDGDLKSFIPPKVDWTFVKLYSSACSGLYMRSSTDHASVCNSVTYEPNVDLRYGDLKDTGSPNGVTADSEQACCQLCANTLGCAHFTFDKGNTKQCWLKGVTGIIRISWEGAISGSMPGMPSVPMPGATCQLASGSGYVDPTSGDCVAPDNEAISGGGARHLMAGVTGAKIWPGPCSYRCRKLVHIPSTGLHVFELPFWSSTWSDNPCLIDYSQPDADSTRDYHFVIPTEAECSNVLYFGLQNEVVNCPLSSSVRAWAKVRFWPGDKCPTSWNCARGKIVWMPLLTADGQFHLGKATESYCAVKLINEHTTLTTAAAFTGLRRAEVMDRLTTLVNFPENFNQGLFDMCTVAAFLHAWAKRDSHAFAQFVIDLYEHGSATMPDGEHTITPSLELWPTDVAIVRRLYEAGHTPPVEQRDPDSPYYGFHVVEWMLLSTFMGSSIEKSKDEYFDGTMGVNTQREGQPLEYMLRETSSHATTGRATVYSGLFSLAIEDWMMWTGLYSSIETTYKGVFELSNLPVADALALNPQPAGQAPQDVIMLVDHRVGLEAMDTQRNHDSTNWNNNALQNANADDTGQLRPNHAIVLQRPITSRDNMLSMCIFTWGTYVPAVPMSGGNKRFTRGSGLVLRAHLDQAYYGAVIGVYNQY